MRVTNDDVRGIHVRTLLGHEYAGAAIVFDDDPQKVETTTKNNDALTPRVIHSAPLGSANDDIDEPNMSFQV